jgi:hypothetical protein
MILKKLIGWRESVKKIMVKKRVKLMGKAVRLYAKENRVKILNKIRNRKKVKFKKIINLKNTNH